MNRYMITREKIKGQEYLISALYDEKKHMIEVLPEAAGETSPVSYTHLKERTGGTGD